MYILCSNVCHSCCNCRAIPLLHLNNHEQSDVQWAFSILLTWLCNAVAWCCHYVTRFACHFTYAWLSHMAGKCFSYVGDSGLIYGDWTPGVSNFPCWNASEGWTSELPKPLPNAEGTVWKVSAVKCVTELQLQFAYFCSICRLRAD